MSQINFTARTEQANEILRNYVIASMGAALIPIPIFDLVALTGIQLKMLHRLSQVYEIEYLAHFGKSLVASLLSGLVLTRAGTILASLAKTFPGVGTATSIVGVSIIGGASSYAIGKVFIQHFESGGTFLTFDPKQVREHFVNEFERGKQVVIELKSTPGPAPTTVTSVIPPVNENKESVAPTSETATLNASEERGDVKLTQPAVEPPPATEAGPSAWPLETITTESTNPMTETVATVETSVPVVTESIIPTAPMSAGSKPIDPPMTEETAATVKSPPVTTPEVNPTDAQNNRVSKLSKLATSIRSAITSPATIDSLVNMLFSPAASAVSESSRKKALPITAVSEDLVTMTEKNTQAHNCSAPINETIAVESKNLDTSTKIEVTTAENKEETVEHKPEEPTVSPELLKSIKNYGFIE